MAAKTPSSVIELGTGTGFRMLKATFTDIDDADTWTSGMSGVVGAWCNGTDDPTTQASQGCDVSVSSGVFTFYPGEDNRTIELYIIARS